MILVLALPAALLEERTVEQNVLLGHALDITAGKTLPQQNAPIKSMRENPSLRIRTVANLLTGSLARE